MNDVECASLHKMAQLFTKIHLHVKEFESMTTKNLTKHRSIKHIYIYIYTKNVSIEKVTYRKINAF